MNEREPTDQAIISQRLNFVVFHVQIDSTLASRKCELATEGIANKWVKFCERPGVPMKV